MRAAAVFFFAALCANPALADSRDQLRIVGSGTVFPFATLAAEQFGKGGNFKTPIVESTGTGGGFKLFCSGLGLDTADINDASRAMTPEEKNQCEKNGVSDVTDIVIGYDGIVLARKKSGEALNLTRKDIFLALARDVPKDGKLVPNSVQSWKQVDAQLPDQPIKIYGTSPVSGTRDTFVELVMLASCMDLPEFKTAYADEKARKAACGAIREDGKFIEAGEDYNATAQKLEGDAAAFAIFGYSFLEQNPTLVQGTNIDGVTPGFDTISGGAYSLSRKLHLYIKNAHLGKVPGLAEFAREITSEAAMGEDGYMVDKGLVPLPAADRAAEHAKATALK